jgi:hypothetical protein
MSEADLMNGIRQHELGGLPFDEILKQALRNLWRWRHPNPVDSHPPGIAWLSG